MGGAFGFMLGGPLGAVLGAALGHNLDKGISGLPDDDYGPGDQQRVQTAFFTATFSVMGAVAKADGRVTADEIALAKAVMAEMALSGEMRETAIRLFNEGKNDSFPLDDVLVQFRKECHRRQNLMQMFMEIQLQAAYADGSMDPAEEKLLKGICHSLGFSELVFHRLERMVQAERGFAGGRRAARSQGPSLEDAYGLLNMAPDASDAEVKKSYRRMMNQHHPDKLVAKGLPEEMMKMAAKKTHEIKQAYETVKAARA
ncbi:MAG: co-chaperone DjlA [Candidatus Polarisedimenticolaceae bacterium]|nr:co-chaperone DjlA [Candidatus Polarisedimenticolaceae bacterium]